MAYLSLIGVPNSRSSSDRRPTCASADECNPSMTLLKGFGRTFPHCRTRSASPRWIPCAWPQGTQGSFQSWSTQADIPPIPCKVKLLSNRRKSSYNATEVRNQKNNRSKFMSHEIHYRELIFICLFFLNYRINWRTQIVYYFYHTGSDQLFTSSFKKVCTFFQGNHL